MSVGILLTADAMLPKPPLPYGTFAVFGLGPVNPFGPLEQRDRRAVTFHTVGDIFGFVPPFAMFYAILTAIVMTYLAMVEVAKKGFYRWVGAPDEPRRTDHDGEESDRGTQPD